MNWSHSLHLPTGFMDPTLWVLLALLVFFGLILFLGFHKKIAKSLDERSDAIQNELDEARHLREEAQKLLASFQRRRREAEQEADIIVEQAEKEAERLAQQARRDLTERLERRTRMAEDRIAQAEIQAEKNIRRAAADLAILACEHFLHRNVTDTDHEDLIQQALQNMDSHWPRA